MTDTPFSLNVAEGFGPVADAFRQNFTEGLEIGAGFCAIREGQVLVDLTGGHADRARTQVFTATTLTPVYSTTKPVAAMVIAMLVDRGVLAYDAPVASVWPEFGAHGKATVTLVQALSHQAGVPGFPTAIDPDLWLDPPALSAALAALTPMWEPGTASGYHPLTYGYIAGEVVRRATARTLGTVLREEITGPLGIDFYIGTPPSEHARCAEMARPTAMAHLGDITPERRAAFLERWSAPARGGPAWRQAEIPSANGHGTARSVADLYQALALQGRIGERRLWSADTHAQLSQRRIIGPDRVVPFICDWGAGVMRNAGRVYGPNKDTLGHSGWGGSCGFGDPALGLSGAYVMNRQDTNLVGDPRAGRLITALYGCLG
jgi:CubicO group peptidase (beta-lactamase class C family)